MQVGLWSIVYGLKSILYALCSMIYALYFMPWSMVYGLWSMGFGELTLSVVSVVVVVVCEYGFYFCAKVAGRCCFGWFLVSCLFVVGGWRGRLLSDSLGIVDEVARCW